jgi:hypothetical protein
LLTEHTTHFPGKGLRVSVCLVASPLFLQRSLSPLVVPLWMIRRDSEKETGWPFSHRASPGFSGQSIGSYRRGVLKVFKIEILKLFSWLGPEGWLATPKHTLARGSSANRSSRIHNSLQTVMICRLVVITLAPPEDPSKQCRQDLVMSPKLYPGLLPFLKSSIRVATSKLEGTHPPKIRLFLRMWARFFRKNRDVLENEGMPTNSRIRRLSR